MAGCKLTLLVHQICECEGLQETVASLKQQLSDALEMRNLSPLASCSQRISELKSLHAQHHADKEIAASKDRDEELLLQTQVSV